MSEFVECLSAKPLTSDNLGVRKTKTKLHSDLTRGSGEVGPREGDKMQYVSTSIQDTPQAELKAAGNTRSGSLPVVRERLTSLPVSASPSINPRNRRHLFLAPLCSIEVGFEERDDAAPGGRKVWTDRVLAWIAARLGR